MKTKKILALVSLPVFALVLSGCGSQSQQAQPETTKTEAPAKADVNQVPTVTTQTPDATDQQAKTLPPLPSDSKKAVDQEINAIDQQLNTADSVSTDELAQ